MEKEREIRLRQRIEELVRSRVGTLEQDISRLQREINQSFTQLLERSDAIFGRFHGSAFECFTRPDADA